MTTDRNPLHPEDAPAPAMGLRWFGEFLFMLAAMAFVFYATSNWKIARYYAIAGVSTSFIFYVTWKAIRTLPNTHRQSGKQFSLRTILWWVVPYVAIAAAIMGWSGSYEEDFLNANAKASSLTILTQFWLGMYMASRFRAASRNRSKDESMASPPHALDRND